MSRVRNMTGKGYDDRRLVFAFAAILLAVAAGSRFQGKSQARKSDAARPSGYRVAAPLLPAVMTQGRKEAKTIEIARDAICCHRDGLRQSGEETPQERTAS